MLHIITATSFVYLSDGFSIADTFVAYEGNSVLFGPLLVLAVGFGSGILKSCDAFVCL